MPKFGLTENPPEWLVEVHREHRPSYCNDGVQYCSCSEDDNNLVEYTPEHLARVVHAAIGNAIIDMIRAKPGGAQQKIAEGLTK